MPLLDRRNSFLVLDLGIDIVDGVRCLDVQVDGLACEHLDEGLLLGGDIDDKDEDEDRIRMTSDCDHQSSNCLPAKVSRCWGLEEFLILSWILSR